MSPEKDNRVAPAERNTLRLELGCLTVAAIAIITLAITVSAFLIGRGSNEDSVAETVRSTPNVLVAVQDLARLETAAYHMERVIDIKDRQQRLFGLIQADDAVLLVAAGDVTAGVDLAKVTQVDVEVDEGGQHARIALPPPEVLITRLDNERTFVHTRTTDTLAKRNEALETRARQEAERSLRNAAIESGILDVARKNAERVVKTLVESLGYSEVTIIWQDHE